jgi:hypothetical protein
MFCEERERNSSLFRVAIVSKVYITTPTLVHKKVLGLVSASTLKSEK